MRGYEAIFEGWKLWLQCLFLIRRISWFCNYSGFAWILFCRMTFAGTDGLQKYENINYLVFVSKLTCLWEELLIKMNLEIWWSKKTFLLLFLAKRQRCLFVCFFNVLWSCFLERQNVHSTSHSYGSLPVLCNFPKHMLLLKYLHDSHASFSCLCSEPSITVITSHSQTNISFNFQGKRFFKKSRSM